MTAARTNDIEIAGPVMLPAVDAVIVKMPAPITTDTPKTVRSHQVEIFAEPGLGFVGVGDRLLDRLGPPSSGHLRHLSSRGR